MVKRESRTAEGTLLMTWQDAVPTRRGDSATSEPRVCSTAGMRARLPENDGDDDEPDIEGEDAEHDEHGEREEDEVDDHPPRGRRGGLRGLELDIHGFDEEAGDGDEQERDRKGQRHDLEEFSRRDGVVGIEIEVLGVAEWGEHAAEVRRHVLHDEDEGGVLLFAAGGEHIEPEGEEGDERHIVCHDHGPEVSDEDERKSDAAHIAERGDDLARQPFEEPALFECADHGEGAEEAGEGVEVEVVGVGGVRGHEKASHRRGGKRHDEDDMTFQKPEKDVHPRRRGVMSADEYAHTEGCRNGIIRTCLRAILFGAFTQPKLANM